MGRDLSVCRLVCRGVHCLLGRALFHNSFMGVTMRKFKDETKKKYLEIYQLRLDGMTYQAIGERFGFTRARAFAICRLAKNYLLPSEQAEVQ